MFVYMRGSNSALVGVELSEYWFGPCLEDMFFSDPCSSDYRVFDLLGGELINIVPCGRLCLRPLHVNRRYREEPYLKVAISLYLSPVHAGNCAV